MKSQALRPKTQNDWTRKLLQTLNLRQEEGERTLLMFGFYTATSVGLLWMEQTTTALFLLPTEEGGFGASWLPMIYIVSAMLGSGLGFLYSWLQNNWALQRVLMFIVLLMALPLLVFRVSLDLQYFDGVLAFVTVFVLRLWMDAEDILNDLNSQVAANQLFNIREIKRAYPIISSGLLLGDVISGFSLPIFLKFVGLENMLIAAAVMILVGGGMLFYLTRRYKQAFPDTPVKDLEEFESDFTSRKLTKSLKRYIIPLFLFFIMGEVLYLLVEVQYLGELELKFQGDDIAGFLGLFAGILGLFELLTQWFVSSRAVERLGVFVAAMFLPVSLSVLGLGTILLDKRFFFASFDSAEILFFSAIALRFFDELLRYTLIAGIEPFLFQPIPSEIRSSIQTWVQGIAEPFTTGVTGAGLLGAIAVISKVWGDSETTETLRQIQGSIFVGAIVFFSIIWAASAWFLRSSYVSLLVQGAEQGRLGFGNIDLNAFKRAVVQALEERKTEGDRRSCIQLLDRIDPLNLSEVLAPMLHQFTPNLQRQSLESMLRSPKPEYRQQVQDLIEQKPPLDVLALGLRYLWLCEPNLDAKTLKPYLNERVDPLVRGTAANLIIQRGSTMEKREATYTLEEMLNSHKERERVVGVQSLPDALHSTLVHTYIPELLQDDSAKVRCALLAIIADKRLDEYYGSLVKGLYFSSTREAAKEALISLGNDAASLLIGVSEDPRQSEFTRQQVWSVMAEIATPDLVDALIQRLMSSWGTDRRNLLRIISKMPPEQGIEPVLERLGRSGVEMLLDQEILFLGQMYLAAKDFADPKLDSEEVNLLRAAMEGAKEDVFERCFLLMKLLYPLSAVQAAILNLNSESQSSIALGLEILDNTLDLPQKRLFLELFDTGTKANLLALRSVGQILPYNPMQPSDRLRHLIQLRHFISPWLLACCFHLAKAKHWSLGQDAVLVCLRHPNSFVREAVLAYLKEASPRICLELLPTLTNDPNPIVNAQVEQLRLELDALG
ncbi:Npt1/Npt2 family nucleotide transporter [[Limnothrix rosea] IAM M-220]|uniref:Npt1/Npt2 family nucleotide transporter n=1 Tax=[Limnothrix rosea] IAM M-220 TaxID=454133 RepID=UPI0009634E26|nr:Npt1/Npt2 family nucleotide transporter [[Limnothrix rosea] IAM M-220]OKH12010.1 MFS transporter [[Limnothrix rosea] IAM M-220]